MLKLLPTILLVALTSCSLGEDPKKATPNLAEAVKAVTGLPEYRTAHWGLYVVDLASGDVLLDHQSDKLFAPASVTKLFSVAAALDALGADHRFRTKVLHTGEYHEPSKTLKGDLIVLASGDLTLGGRPLPDGSIAFKDNDHTYANGNTRGQLTDVDPLQGLHQLARLVAEKVGTLQGDVLIDDRLFDKAESTGSGPGRLTPVLVNDNLIDFTITPGEEGQPAKVEHRPQSITVQVDAQVETVEKGRRPNITITASPPGRFVVRGQMPAGHKPLVRVREVDDAAAHLRALFIEALIKAGVKTRISPLSATPPDQLPARDAVAKLPMLGELVSAPFAENAKLILKVSHNLHASTLPLLLAAQGGKRTLTQGLRLEGERLRSLGVPKDMASFGGGAGGSRADFVTPQGTVALLRTMAKRSDFEVYRRALPILGVDGTLAKSVGAKSPAKGKFFAKTGTLTWNNGLGGHDLLTSKALAGYGETTAGRKVAFAFFVNNVFVPEDGALKVGSDLGKLCEIVYRSE
jgi:D-alanyl-D-alanine carboxypeptidase/D-alanyl-D-alanine-endopeptidase (penicillin-binding protein 4)